VEKEGDRTPFSLGQGKREGLPEGNDIEVVSTYVLIRKGRATWAENKGFGEKKT